MAAYVPEGTGSEKRIDKGVKQNITVAVAVFPGF
jgi:hypothetical protein